MKERVLCLSLKGAVEAFQAIKWKFFEDRDGAVRVEVPRGSDESYVVELPYGNEQQRGEIVGALEDAGYVRQVVRIVCDW